MVSRKQQEDAIKSFLSLSRVKLEGWAVSSMSQYVNRALVLFWLRRGNEIWVCVCRFLQPFECVCLGCVCLYVTWKCEDVTAVRKADSSQHSGPQRRKGQVAWAPRGGRPWPNVPVTSLFPAWCLLVSLLSYTSRPTPTFVSFSVSAVVCRVRSYMHTWIIPRLLENLENMWRR